MLAEQRRRRRRVLRRLQHGRVPAEDGRERLPRVVRQRRVERDDQRRDADGPTRRHDGPVRHRRRRRAPVQPPPLARDEEAHLDRGVGLAERELARLARLLDDRVRELVASSLQRELQARAGAARARRASASPTPAGPSAQPRRRPRRPRRRTGGCVHNREPSAGRTFSNVWPDAAGVARPSMRFRIEGICKTGIVRPR